MKIYEGNVDRPFRLLPDLISPPGKPDFRLRDDRMRV